MLAPSFQTYEIISEIFTKGNKPYVKVRNPKTSNVREVRFYSEDEYRRLYSKTPKAANPESTDRDAVWEFYKNEANNPNFAAIFGFDKGPVRIYRYQIPKARFHVGLGWYLVAGEPDDGSPHIEISWEEFHDEDCLTRCHKPSILAAIVAEKWRRLDENS